MAQKLIGKVRFPFVGQTNARFLLGNNTAFDGHEKYTRGVTGTLHESNDPPRYKRLGDGEGTPTPVLATKWWENAFIAASHMGTERSVPATMHIALYADEKNTSEVIPPATSNWHDQQQRVNLGSAETGYISLIGASGPEYAVQNGYDNLVSTLSKLASTFVPSTSSPFFTDKSVSIDISKMPGYTTSLPSTLVLSVENQKKLMISANELLVAKMAATLKITSQSVEPNKRYYLSTSHLTSPPPINVTYTPVVMDFIEVEFYGDTETGSITPMLAGVPIGGGSKGDANDEWATFLIVKEDYETTLARETAKTSVGLFTFYPPSKLVRPTSINALTSSDQKRIAERWFEDYLEAASGLKNIRTSDEAYQLTDKSLSKENWLTSVNAEINGISKENPKGLWDSAKSFIMSAAGKTGEFIASTAGAAGKYITSYSPNDWVNTGAKIWGLTEANQVLGSMPAWIKWGGLGLITYLILK